MPLLSNGSSVANVDWLIAKVVWLVPNVDWLVTHVDLPLVTLPLLDVFEGDERVVTP